MLVTFIVWSILALVLILPSYETESSGLNILQYPDIPSIGHWYKWQECENNTFVQGFRIKSRTFQGAKGDDAGIVGITLYCMENGSENVEEEIGLYSTESGEWTQDYFCPSRKSAIGFHFKYSWENWKKIRIKKTSIKLNKTSLTLTMNEKRDLVGMTNLRLICEDQDVKDKRQSILEPKEELFEPGTWLVPSNCPMDEVVCGLQVQFGSALKPNSTNVTDTDFVGINNIRLSCCAGPDIETETPEMEIPKTPETHKNPKKDESPFMCMPEDKMELLFEYDNRNGLSSVNYSYEVKFGVGKIASFDLNPSELDIQVYRELRRNFMENLGKSRKTRYDWTNSASDIWTHERSAKMTIEVIAGSFTQIYQLVGFCDDYIVRPNKIIQNGTLVEPKNVENNALSVQTTTTLSPPPSLTTTMMANNQEQNVNSNSDSNGLRAQDTSMILMENNKMFSKLGLILGDKMAISSLIMFIMGIFLYLT